MKRAILRYKWSTLRRADWRWGCVPAIVTERTKTGCCVGAAVSVVKKGEHPIGRVVVAGSVVQERPGASRRVIVGSVGKKRPGADGSVEVAGRLL